MYSGIFRFSSNFSDIFQFGFHLHVFLLRKKKVITIALKEGELHSLMWLVGPSIHLCLTHQMVWPHLAFRIWTLLLFFAAWEQTFPLRHLYCCFLLNPWKEAVANSLPSAYSLHVELIWGNAVFL